MSDQLTQEQFEKVLPKTIKGKITAGVLDTVNTLMKDPVLRENYRDNLLSYTSVMKDGRFKLQQYIDAVRYVSYKLMGASNIEAYTKTFPDRFQRLVDEGADDKTISSYCAAYNKTILVNKILEQTMVPVHVLNADIYQKAIKTQAELMITANSEKVRSDAANSLLTHLKAPEVAKMELNVTTNQDSAVDDLRDAARELVKQQKQMLTQGSMSVKDLAHSDIISREKVIDGELVNG